MRHLFTVLALTALLTVPALAYQVDRDSSPGLADVILEQAVDTVLAPLAFVAQLDATPTDTAPVLLVVQERGSTVKGVASTDTLTALPRVDNCAASTVTYAETVECQRLRPPAWQPVRHDAYAVANLDTTMRDTRSQTWPIPSPRQSTPSSLATAQ